MNTSTTRRDFLRALGAGAALLTVPPLGFCDNKKAQKPNIIIRITDNMFVLFFSDNGAIGYGDNGPWRSGKGSVYEGGVRVPAVVRWPVGIRGGRNVDAMMGYIDVYPTVKSIAGITDPDPNPLDGRDMLEVIRGKAKASKRNWFSYIAQGTPDKTAICDGTWITGCLGRQCAQRDTR